MVDAVAGLGMPPVTATWKVLKTLVNVGRRLPVVDRFVDDLERETLLHFLRNADLDFFSKDSRVARLRLAEGASRARIVVRD